MTELDLGRGVLDHQLVDRDGRRCGKVDDLELEGLDSDAPRVTALVVGPPAWRSRGRLGRLAARAARRASVRVPWGQVRDVGSGVELRSSASELGLGVGDDRARTWVERFPGSSL